VHPGHKFALLESHLDLGEAHSGEPCPHDRADDPERPEGPDEPRERHVDSHSRTPRPAEAFMSSSACGVCRERLLDMCYECGQCARGFCARCVAFHPKDHVLQTVFKVVNSDESGGEGRGQPEHGPSRSAGDHDDERSSDSRSDAEVSDLPLHHSDFDESDMHGSHDSGGSDEDGSDEDGFKDEDERSDSLADNARRNRRRRPMRATFVRIEIPHNTSIRDQVRVSPSLVVVSN